VHALNYPYRSATEPSLPVPTAVQAAADEHETAPSEAGEYGVVWSVQLVPSQNSAKDSPTAMQSVVLVALVHDTERR